LGAISASTVSTMNVRLDHKLAQFFFRRLETEYPYLILDARYKKVRIDGVIRSQAVLVAISINWDGRREVLGVELANRESLNSWKEFLDGLRQRGLRGTELVITDDHQGLKKAVAEMFPEAAWQRCYVHFLRNAIDHLPLKADDDCLMELRWLYDRRSLEEAWRDLGVWLKKWQSRYPKLCNWVEETFTLYRWPLAHHKHLKSANMFERVNEELKRRSLVIRIFPNPESCLRLMRALMVEIHEDWIEQHLYLNMELFREHKKMKLVQAA
jgi:putative transposase